jgi:two-component system response regulator YesN
MYRLLIVDDEPYIVDSLYNFFQGVKHIELDVYKAYSAIEAMGWLSRTLFDIVVTDIHMPGMDGLELMRNIKQKWPECRIVFLTGYENFDYIYTINKFDGVKYVLKTEGRQAILNAVEWAVKELEDKFNSIELFNSIRIQNEAALPYLQKEFILDILNSNITLDEESRKFASSIKFPFSLDDCLMLVVAHVDQILDNKLATDKPQTYQSIQLVSETFLKPVFKYIQVEYDASYLIWVLQPDTQGNGAKPAEDTSWKDRGRFLKGSVEGIQRALADNFNLYVSFAIDTESANWNSISERYNNTRRLLNYSISTQASMQIIEMVDSTNIPSVSELHCDMFPSSQKCRSGVRKLENSLECGKKEEALRILEKFGEYFENCTSMHYNPAIEAYFSIALVLLSHINSYGLCDKLPFRIPLYKLMNIEHHNSWKDAMVYLCRLIDEIFSIKLSEAKKRNNNIINTIKQYIEDHLSEDLSLAKLGELVYYNPTYLSRFFKQETGTTVLAYINRARVNKAKELLEQSQMKISEIALAVGYSSPQYFTHFFKRETGFSPQEYRDALIRKSCKET